MPKAPALTLGENVVGTLDENGILHLVIDTKRALRRSKVRVTPDGRQKGGENIIIATTSGNTLIPGLDAKLGLNLYRPPTAAETV